MKEKAETAIDLLQQYADNYQNKVKVALDITTKGEDEKARIKALAAQRQREDAELAKTRAKTEVDARRMLEDSKSALTRDANKREEGALKATYTRQVEDLKTRLKEDTTLTAKAKDDLRAVIKNKEEEEARALTELHARHTREREALEREAEDRRIAAIPSEYDRRREEIEAQAKRDEEDTLARLNSDEALIEGRAELLTKKLVDIEKKRAKEITEANRRETEKRNEQMLADANSFLREFQAKTGELVVRDREGLQLIDVDATRKNFAAYSGVLDEYVAQMRQAAVGITAAHNKTMEGLQKGTPEYEAEMLKYGQTMAGITGNITQAQQDQADVVKDSQDVWSEYFGDLGGKMQRYAAAALEAFTSVTDTLNMIFQEQLDGLNVQLETIDANLEEATARREAAADRVAELEEQMQNASGSTASALKEQLQEEMHNRAEAAREEQRLQKEKEKKEAEIAKKEKQMKRADLVAQIAQGIASSSLAVIEALTLGPILGPIFAAIIGTMGLAQVSIMTRQLAKMEDGGLLVGPSHAAGGMRIAGTNIEVEGEEFVENRHSTRNNRPLVEFINAAGRDRALTLSDLAGIVPGEIGAPTIIQTSGPGDLDRVIDAISRIKFSPKVSVVEILDMMDEVTSVRDLADFG